MRHLGIGQAFADDGAGQSSGLPVHLPRHKHRMGGDGLERRRRFIQRLGLGHPPQQSIGEQRQAGRPAAIEGDLAHPGAFGDAFHGDVAQRHAFQRFNDRVRHLVLGAFQPWPAALA
jgi:hypothetical protein